MALVKPTPDQIAQFQSVVHKHILALDDAVWNKWRTYAMTSLCRRGHVATEEVIAQEGYNLTRGEIAEHVGDSSLTIDDLPGEIGHYQVIGEVHCEPVYYLPKEGIYAWAPGRDHFWVLDVWLSHPAPPPAFR